MVGKKPALSPSSFFFGDTLWLPTILPFPSSHGINSIITNSGNATLLNDSDATFGNAAHYEKHGSRKADAGLNSDQLRLDHGQAKLDVLRMKAGRMIDELRILTE